MKRIARFLPLFAASSFLLLISFAIPAWSAPQHENRSIGENQIEAKRAAKQQQKINKKLAKQQRKAMKKYQKQQHQAAKQQHHR